jgi:hypothetical protein
MARDPASCEGFRLSTLRRDPVPSGSFWRSCGMIISAFCKTAFDDAVVLSRFPLKKKQK